MIRYLLDAQQVQGVSEIIIIIAVAIVIVMIAVMIWIIKAIIRTGDNTDRIRERLDIIQEQNAELIRLTELQNELIALEIREQRTMHGFPVNVRLDGERPDE